MACELVSALVSELVGSSLELLEESALSVAGSGLELELEPEPELDCPCDEELSTDMSELLDEVFKLELGTV